jgi:hypothetical protein
MTTAMIVNGAPMTIFQRTDDLSTQQVTPVPEQIPQHLPYIYLYAQMGPTTEEVVSGVDLTNMYGADSFDLRKVWANHATVLANSVNAQGNAIMIRRLQPDDANPPASLRLWLDVLPAPIPQYGRNPDGSFTTDETGNPVPVTGANSTLDGFIVKWVVSTVAYNPDGSSDYGAAEILAGDQSAGSITSQRYPVMDLLVPSFGAYGNNNGLRLWAPTANASTAANANFIEDDLVYPFRVSCVTRPLASSTGSVARMTNGSTYLDVTFKPAAIDTALDAQISIQDIFLNAWQDLNNPAGTADVYGPFGSLHVYDGNVATLVGMFYAAESVALNAWSDFTGADGEEWLFNFVSGMSSMGAPYSTFQVNTADPDAAYLGQASTLWASGGSDGTMNDASFAALVAADAARFADPADPVQEMVMYPYSHFWDSGFPIDTKKALAQFISQRPDTFITLSTFSTLSPPLTASEESSMAVALKAFLQQYPESDYFGTPCARGMVVPGSGMLTGSLYTAPLPLTIELASKTAAYMGAGNGKWKSGFSFDMQPGSQINLFSNINVTFWPATARNQDWANGMVGVEACARRQAYFPALKTIYDNDTSVLNSFFTVSAICTLEKIGDLARRQFSGVSSMTNAQLIKNVNSFITTRVANIFDNRFTITPTTTITGADAQRNYSWTTIIQIAAAGMKTVATIVIQSVRLDQSSTATT